MSQKRKKVKMVDVHVVIDKFNIKFPKKSKKEVKK